MGKAFSIFVFGLFAQSVFAAEPVIDTSVPPAPAVDASIPPAPEAVVEVSPEVKKEEVTKKKVPEKINIAFAHFSYLKPLGAIKNITPSGWQFGVEWNRLFPVRKNKWQTHAGVTVRRATLKSNIDHNSKASGLRTDYLLLYGYSFGSGIRGRLYTDVLLGILNRRLYISSGDSTISDDFYLDYGWGGGLRAGLEAPFKIKKQSFMGRIGFEYITGTSMLSPPLHYNRDRVDINGANLTFGLNVGWLF